MDNYPRVTKPNSMDSHGLPIGQMCETIFDEGIWTLATLVFVVID